MRRSTLAILAAAMLTVASAGSTVAIETTGTKVPVGHANGDDSPPVQADDGLAASLLARIHASTNLTRGVWKAPED